jgi:hypothetical protein
VVIAYARPFTKNKLLGPLAAEWSKFANLQFQETHHDLIKSRHQFIAHSDEEVRKVEIFPLGAPVGKTRFKSGNVGITVRTIVFLPSRFLHIRDLCFDLGDRLERRVNSLLVELYAGRELPAEMFPLTFDEGL